MKRAVLPLLAAGAMVLATAPAALAVGDSPTACAQPDARVAAISISNGTAYIGGSFTHVKNRAGVSSPRAGLAAIDTGTCDLLPWSAAVSGDVLALQAVGNTVYVGGSFTSINGASRSGLAALDASDATLLPFSHKLDGSVHALATSGAKVYAGGDFRNVDGAGRHRLAAFSTSTGALDQGWAPDASRTVDALAMSADLGSVYVGGRFTSLNSESAPDYLASVDSDTGDLQPGFGPDLDAPVLALAADSRGVYAGTGGLGGHLAVLNLDGSLQRPVYQTDGGVQAVAVSGDSLYAGGHFTNYCVGNTGSGRPFVCDQDLPRRKVFEVSLSTGQLTGWAPALNSARGVFAAQVGPAGDLWLGGDFTKVDALTEPHLAVFPGSGSTRTVPGAPTGLAASAGDGTVGLSWRPPADTGGSAISGYTIYRATGSGAFAAVGSSSTAAYTDTAVTNGTTYRYRVSASNGTGEGAASSEVSGTPQGGGPSVNPPAAPGGVTGTAGPGTATLTWSAPSDDGGSPVTGYAIYRSTTAGAETLLTTVGDTRSYTDSAVQAGNPYYYQVSAVNSAGPGQRSTEVSVTPAPSGGGGPCGTKVGQTPTINHVVMLTFENKSRDQVIGQSYAPYLNSLADECGQATKMMALSNTSLANYIALTSGYIGHPAEITSNRSPKIWPQDSVSIFEQLGTESRELSEDAPSNCWAGSSPDLFAVNHTPLPYYTRIPKLCQTQDVPMGDVPDLSAKFTLISPNKRHIMHSDGTATSKTRQQQVANGDEWAAQYVPKILASPQYRAGDTVLIVVWDEGSASNQNVPFIVVSPWTPVGYTTNATLDHYSTLRGIEETFNLPLLGNAATAKESLRSYFGLS
ncbi:MAG TPA: fibronectin type III domain-containing protein [Streptomyces sp.]|nr:fibronectin type III domain-containing protein [Streptomyces sp.]